MSQHFLLSAKARTLSLSAILRMTDEQAKTAFIRIRWASTEGKPVCVHCGCPTVWDCRKANGKRLTPLALQGVSQELLNHQRDHLRITQDAAPQLPCGDCHLRR
jgi:hypothetical protein